MASGVIQTYQLDGTGVVVDAGAESSSDPARLTKAQNAISDPLGSIGAISTRPGLKRINSTAGDGSVRGGTGVPVGLGSAGPIVRNPFTDLTVTIDKMTAPNQVAARLGATFDDESDWLDWDWLGDFSELVSIDDGDPLDVSGNGPADSPALGLVAPTLIGNTDGDWFTSLDVALDEATDNGTTYSNTDLLVFPTGKLRSGMTGFSTSGGGLSSALSGAPACVLDNRLYYADGTYTVGTDAPPIRVFDGYTDRIACRIPRSVDVSTTAASKLINTLYAANGLIYITTQDGGTVSSSTGIGSVWVFNPVTGAVQKIGATFSTDQIPLSLLWAYGRLWVGTASNNSSAKVYWIRPGVDTSWTADVTLASGEAAVRKLEIFQGEIYAAVLNRSLAGTCRLKVRSTLGSWSDSDTGTLDTNSGHLAWRGYHDVFVWPPEDSGITSPAPTLYALRQGATEDTWPNLAIRQLSAGSWSTVETPASGGDALLMATYAIASKTLVPVLWYPHGTTILNTQDGSTWTDRSSNYTLTGSAFVMPPIFLER